MKLIITSIFLTLLFLSQTNKLLADNGHIFITNQIFIMEDYQDMIKKIAALKSYDGLVFIDGQDIPKNFPKSNFILPRNHITLTVNQVNFSEYRLQLSSVDQSFFLIFLENFNKDWKVYLKDSKEVNNVHFTVNGYANGWLLDFNLIKNTFKDKLKQNPDGTFDFELILYYQPQSYFYVGLGISILAIIICFYYLYRRNNKVDKDMQIKHLLNQKL